MSKTDKKQNKVSIFSSIRFKLIMAVVVGGIMLMLFMLWLLTDSIGKVERTLMDSRLAADIEYLRDELVGDSDASWYEKDGALYIGDTLIGDGTLENANEDVFYHCEEITGTFYYTFVRTYNDDELGYVDSGKYYQGHYKRVAGTTKGPNGENIEGTYIDKIVADELERSLEETGKGLYGGRANVNGRMIYCRYELLMSKDNEVVGIIVVGRSVEEMDAILLLERLNAMTAFVIGLFLICAGIGVTISMMIGAIGKIKERLDLIGDGHFPDEPLQLKTKDELSNIADSINEMVDSLKEKERIGAELDVASRIQTSFLPCIFPAFPDKKEFDIYATMNPAKEVGGDFYDFFLVDENHLALVIADVSGKGVPAALFMVIAKTLIKNIALTGVSPSQIMTNVNKQLCENNDEEMFVTAWIGILDLTTGKMVCANAGHERPAIRRANGEYELVADKHGFVLGGIETTRYNEYEIELNRGDEVYVYTDGVTEATDSKKELYGTDRLTHSLNANLNQTSRQILSSVKKSIDEFVGSAPQFDDITMLSVRYFGNKE